MSLTPTSAEFCAWVADLLGRGNAVRFQARGDSMRPWIRDGDVVTLEPANPAEIKHGDVVAFQGAGGRLFVHRVIAIRERDARRVFVARGDARGVNDKPFRASKILGRVSEVRRAGKLIKVHGVTRHLRAVVRNRIAGMVRRVRKLAASNI